MFFKVIDKLTDGTIKQMRGYGFIEDCQGESKTSWYFRVTEYGSGNSRVLKINKRSQEVEAV